MKPDEKPETTDAIYGQCVEIGNDNDGQPMLIIHTTKEAIKAFSGSMLYRPVAVMPVEQPETPVEQRQIVSEGDHSAPAVKAARIEICAFLDEISKEADECAKFAQSATLRTDRAWHSGAAMAYNRVWRKLKEITEK